MVVRKTTYKKWWLDFQGISINASFCNSYVNKCYKTRGLMLADLGFLLFLCFFPKSDPKDI